MSTRTGPRLTRYAAAASGHTGRLLLLLALVLVLAATQAASTRINPDAVRFQNYDVEQGLSHGRVRAIAQDRDGYIWVATRDGLNRFDGRSFRVYRYDPNDPGSLPDNVVMSLATTRDGVLWLGTAGGGLARYDAERDRFIRYRSDATTGLAGNYIRTLHADARGDLWVGSFGVGIQRFDPVRGRASDAAFGRPAALRNVHRVIDLPDGGLLFVAGTNLIRWDGQSEGVRALLPEQQGEVERSTEWAILDRRGELWMGLIDGGVTRLDLEGNVLADYRAGPNGAIRGGQVRGLLETRRGEVWIGTSGGVARYDADSDRFVDIRHDDADRNSPPADVYVLFEDRSGLIWGGSSGQGLAVHDPDGEVVAVYHRRGSDPSSLPMSAVQAVLPAPDGSLWLGLARGGGLVHFRPGQGVLTHYHNNPADPASLPDDGVSALAFSRDGGLWIGFDAHGMARLDRGAKTFQHYRRIATDATSLPANSINDLYVDADDTLWVGSDGGGLGSLCHGCTTFERYRVEADDSYDLSVATVTGLVEHTDRSIWFGLFGGGVARLDRNTRLVRRFVTGAGAGNGPSNDVVRAPYVDRRGNLWLGTGTGLDRVVHEAGSGQYRFVFQGSAGGDGSDSIVCVVEDAAGVLWLGTNSGLQRFDPASGRPPQRVSILGDLDRRGYANNACRTAGDDVYFGSLAGLVVFAPASLPAAAAIGPVVLNDLLLFNAPVRPTPDDADAVLQRTLAYTERVRLDHQHDVFGFGFASLDYRDASRIGFRYRLDGLHDDWVPTLPGQRSVTFTAVPAGNYRFRVQALRDGSEPRETAIDLSIDPAPWRSRWAYAAYALLIVAGMGRVMYRNQRRLEYARQVAATIQRSEEALRRLNDELESRVAQRTADLSQSNQELTTTLTRLRQAQQQLVEAEKLASLGGLVAGIAHEINTPLGVCLTAASHLHEQARNLSRLLQTDQLRRSDLDQFERTASEGSDLILRNLQRADRLVRSFKQTAVDQSTDEWRELDLEQSVRDALVMLGPVLKHTPHRLTVECAQPIRLYTSPGALYQIVSNVVLNAVQHAFSSDRAGTIRIAMARDEAGMVSLTLCDDGRGMDTHERTHAFDPFFTTRRSQGGSGLGLHIVYNLVTQVLHGRIDCESESGSGTCFVIHWSAPQQPASSAA